MVPSRASLSTPRWGGPTASRVPLSAAAPTRVFPTSTQCMPTSDSQPSGLVSACTRWARHSMICFSYGVCWGRVAASGAGCSGLQAAMASAATPSEPARMIRFIGSSASTQKKSVQFGFRKLYPGRTPVVALPRTLGRFHLAQQGIHFMHGEPPVGAHCAVGQAIVANSSSRGSRRRVACRLLAQVGEHVAQQCLDIAMTQAGQARCATTGIAGRCAAPRNPVAPASPPRARRRRPRARTPPGWSGAPAAAACAGRHRHALSSVFRRACARVPHACRR